MMENSRHFPMTDEPDRFLHVLKNFLHDDQSTTRRNQPSHGISPFARNKSETSP